MNNGNTLSQATPPRLLLHSCCGPCSTSVIERLASNYDITVFYYNPCITDRDEYLKRLDTQKKFIKAYNKNACGAVEIKFSEGDYDTDAYLKYATPYAEEPEGGKRCEICFKIRLMETAKVAQKNKFDCFATTLTVSPHKNYDLISKIGNEVGKHNGVPFLDLDFKKKAGFQRSVELAKEYELYRQNFCGCEFSRR